MNFGSPPTDNLYKFISIFGLVLLGAIVFFMYRLERDYRIESMNLELQQNILISQSRALYEDLKGANDYISLLDSELQSLNKSNLSKNDYNSYIEKFNSIVSKRDLEREKHETFTKRARENEEKQLKVQYNKNILIMNLNEKTGLQKIAKIGLILSIILILLGFCLWYIKLQVYQDAILRKQANMVSNDIDKVQLDQNPQ
jgi:hypothetical protein